VLLFTLGISVLTSFVFGLIPSLQAGKTDVQETLKEGGNTMSAGAVGGWLRPMLVVVEVAAAVVLLIGAGLMIRSILRIREVEPGLRWQNLLVCENFCREKNTQTPSLQRESIRSSCCVTSRGNHACITC
jgi:putative ABC transport system permease protein